MMFRKPTMFFLASGHAEGFTQLNAFDQALLAAGVGDTNLVRMSSILPPDCRRIEPLRLPYGALVPVAYAEMTSGRSDLWIAAAVAVAIPMDPTLPGLIMEHHEEARLQEVIAHTREMAIQGMAFRNREIREVLSIGAEHKVQRHGAVFAGLVLWDDGV
ncbi:MAG: arginine decarboxylase, pyruvoyl-dependent [Bradymonadales bacterium]|nr:arginine decarboxylase, pyruvoyl-dependent [Bradymonadales bacterium]